MIRPASFDYNPQTAVTNSMMQRPGVLGAPAHNDLARAEFQHMVNALRGEGIAVCVADDTPQPPKPDAIFPNNWVSFHADGTIVLYPMLAPNRRLERRAHRLHDVVEQGGYEVARLVDLTHYELEERYLEGTGSVVFDHVARVAFACLSPRTHREVLDELCEELGYRACAFTARDASGVPIYHTNVLLAIGRRFAVVCAESIDRADRDRVLTELASRREVIAIDYAQLHSFAGNLLELAGRDGTAVLALSRSALESLPGAKRAQLERHVDTLVAAAVPTIERVGGGSVRCMLAEIFLPQAKVATP
jgi:hypothetical protein